MQYWDKVLVPFHYFVKPEPQLTSPPSRLPFPFLRLPIDLQLIIYEHCDAPTLFQLMRTCSCTRHAATKLFWKNTSTDHCYHCPDNWLSIAALPPTPSYGTAQNSHSDHECRDRSGEARAPIPRGRRRSRWSSPSKHNYKSKGLLVQSWEALPVCQNSGSDWLFTTKT